MPKCHFCGNDIPKARLEALPDTKTCLSCSQEEPVKGHMVWNHKTAPTLEVLPPEEFKKVYALERRGFHANVPVFSPNNPWLVKSAQAVKDRAQEADLVREVVVGIDLGKEESYAVFLTPTTHPAARCHPDRPKATADGKCLECAIDWYKKRIKT